ncbi:hypothetical protein ASPVEDRAFT_66052 [Aspergillus versicolor CBS 583.65]|uniref:Conidiation-specific protein 13 n=1 Tax=Aspergillus versicolor CBS 583.65 TaxID=1036611 RepID=A0A1L9Q2B8_ASPVE|nr:uncharacterized protein ASPVEDRAFT_66052 [Aspergillus versicolor CBS 583.65]OJJ07852.1 hypothetical protein ASPVEDRAFT_66052 [Aspergillus versicolor CBS 583.65]
MLTKSAFLAAALAAIPASAALDKPALTPDLDYLLDGNTANLPQNGGAHWGKWEDGLMPEDCKSIAEGQDLNPADFEVYDVFYDDCQDAWSFCRHKDSPEDLETLVNTFGRVPVRMRSWVRHVLSIPGNNWAFNSNGNIALSGTTTHNLDVCLHETGHSLDLLGAYVDGALSSTQEWEDAYNKDSAVPDNYARTNQVENVAQNTVVGIYDKVVPGGFPGVQSESQKIENQYKLLQDKAGEQILPGGTCDRHLQNSATVSIKSSSKRENKVVKAREAHDSALKGTYTNIVKEFTPFNTKDFHEEH